MADVIEQDVLVEMKGRRPIKLPEPSVCPALGGKRLPGEVEIHQNGTAADKKCAVNGKGNESDDSDRPKDLKTPAKANRIYSLVPLSLCLLSSCISCFSCCCPCFELASQHFILRSGRNWRRVLAIVLGLRAVAIPRSNLNM